MPSKTETAIIIVVILLIFFGGFYLGYNLKQCPNISTSTTTSTNITFKDSFAVNKDTAKLIVYSKPKLIKKSKFVQNNLYNINKSKCDTSIIYNNCKDTNFYQLDTVLRNYFKATTKAVITNNELINLQVIYENLVPEKWKIKTVTNTIETEKKQSLVKVYVGIYAGVGTDLKFTSISSFRGGVGFNFVFADKHSIGIQGGLNNKIQPQFDISFFEKIRFKN